jgi:tol-pal system protein YbgF
METLLREVPRAHRRADASGAAAWALVAFASILGATGCASGVDELKKEVSALHSEVTGLRADAAALSERVDALEIANGGLKGYKDPGASSGAGSDRPEDLAVVKLGPSTGGDDSNGRTVLRSGSGGVIQEDAKGDDAPSGNATTDFAKAKELYDRKSWNDALGAFGAFLVRYPDSPRAAEATYYRGVCYAAKNDPRHAAEQFEAVLSASPKSDKAADALEALAKAYDKLGDKAAADRAKKRLKAEYPKSSGAKKND